MTPDAEPTMVRRRVNDTDLEKYWRQAIERQKASGLSIKAFCDAEGLTDHKFWYWERTLKTRDRAAKALKSGRDRNRQSNISQPEVQAPTDRKRVPALERRAKKEEEFWSAILEEWQQSRVSLRQFAQKRMVGYKSLCSWRRKLLPESCNEPEHDQSGDTALQHDFAPVRLVGDEDQVPRNSKGGAAGNVGEIVLKCGRLIRISSDFPLDFLGAVISAAEVI